MNTLGCLDRPTAVSLPNAVNYILYLAEKNRGLDLPDSGRGWYLRPEGLYRGRKRPLLQSPG